MNMFYHFLRSGSMFRRLFVVVLLLAYAYASCAGITDFDEKAKCHIEMAQQFAKQGELDKAIAECKAILEDTKKSAKSSDCKDLQKAFSEHPITAYFVPCIESITSISNNDVPCGELWNAFKEDPMLCFDPGYEEGPAPMECKAQGNCADECEEAVCEMDTKLAKAIIDSCYNIPEGASPNVHLCPLTLVLLIPLLLSFLPLKKDV